jgi:hypothetical protein
MKNSNGGLDLQILGIDFIKLKTRVSMSKSVKAQEGCDVISQKKSRYSKEGKKVLGMTKPFLLPK